MLEYASKPVLAARLFAGSNSETEGSAMALVVCPRHGLGSAAVCSHVGVLVRARAPIRLALFSVSVSYAGHTLGPTWVCPECAARFEIPARGVTLSGDEGLERFWCEMDWEPVCPGCFEAWRAG